MEFFPTRHEAIGSQQRYSKNFQIRLFNVKAFISDVDEDSEVVFPDYLQHALKGKEDKVVKCGSTDLWSLISASFQIREIEDGLENLKNIPLWLTEMNMNTGKPKLAKTPKVLIKVKVICLCVV